TSERLHLELPGVVALLDSTSFHDRRPAIARFGGERPTRCRGSTRLTSIDCHETPPSLFRPVCPPHGRPASESARRRLPGNTDLYGGGRRSASTERRAGSRLVSTIGVDWTSRKRDAEAVAFGVDD